MDDAGTKRFYTPDFYLVDEKSYLEVKGYETALDHAKWRAFTERLIVWREPEVMVVVDILEGRRSMERRTDLLNRPPENGGVGSNPTPSAILA